MSLLHGKSDNSRELGLVSDGGGGGGRTFAGHLYVLGVEWSGCVL
jgi:hypothetical protein